MPVALFTKTTPAPAICPPETSPRVPRIAPVDASWEKVSDVHTRVTVKRTILRRYDRRYDIRLASGNFRLMRVQTRRWGTRVVYHGGRRQVCDRLKFFSTESLFEHVTNGVVRICRGAPTYATPLKFYFWGLLFQRRGICPRAPLPVADPCCACRTPRPVGRKALGCHASPLNSLRRPHRQMSGNRP